MMIKKIARLIFDEFIYGGHLVAIGPVIIVLIFCNIFKLQISVPLLIAVYLITYSIHLFDRRKDLDLESSTTRQSHFNRYKKFIPLIIILSLFVSFLLIYNQGQKIIFFYLIIIILGLSYSIFLKNITKFIPGFKSVFVSLVYSSVILFVVFYYNIEFISAFGLIMLFFGLRWFTDTIFCDIKDRDIDSKQGLRTIASSLNLKHLYLLLNLINIFSIVPLIIGIFVLKSLPLYTVALCLSPIYGYYYINKSKKRNCNLQDLCNIYADGEPLIWGVLILWGGAIWKY